MKQTFRIGTRGSQLALWQADFVQRSLERIYPDHRFERIIIKTEGDQDQHSSLKVIGGQGVFTKAIELGLLREEIDIAVHSLKDLPSAMDPDLMLGAVPERGPVEDVLVSREGISLAEMPLHAKIATGSIRRQSQILEKRPDISMTDLRGNIHTRLNKLNEEDLDAIIMARAALVRLKIENIHCYTFSTEEMIPAVGQGAIGIQIRKKDQEAARLVAAMNHAETWMSVTAERALLHTLDSGCQFPVGAHGRVYENSLEITGFVGTEDGSKVLKEKHQAEAVNAEAAGRILAEKLIERGALNLLNIK
jgi:hydroxymethylbilane synthase